MGEEGETSRNRVLGGRWRSNLSCALRSVQGGASVGDEVGAGVGDSVGALVGDGVGAWVGALVGAVVGA